ncbi:50S ribosomal protein L14 [Buchnera aphidicola (Cinara tujafilina)]|uniref:50S ribosomal protein L14 n=1 Tax=Buchnera aphidicola (Cinara tujafilina) TaxID=261317 RepID=F7WZP0_9GAMM|nr:50S ribosomal protein L14 [Buchnera aphidicola (Cinara tujafilina)]
MNVFWQTYYFYLNNYNTSGANEIIFINDSFLNSLVTGPKIRVPIGCPVVSFKITQAFLSKRIVEPSVRQIPFLVRTITAFITSPFFTLLRGIASLIATLIISPILAYRRFEPPKTLMHIANFAPELSAIYSIVCT